MLLLAHGYLPTHRFAALLRITADLLTHCVTPGLDRRTLRYLLRTTPLPRAHPNRSRSALSHAGGGSTRMAFPCTRSNACRWRYRHYHRSSQPRLVFAAVRV